MMAASDLPKELILIQVATMDGAIQSKIDFKAEVFPAFKAFDNHRSPLFCKFHLFFSPFRSTFEKYLRKS